MFSLISGRVRNFLVDSSAVTSAKAAAILEKNHNPQNLLMHIQPQPVDAHEPVEAREEESENQEESEDEEIAALMEQIRRRGRLRRERLARAQALHATTHLVLNDAIEKKRILRARGEPISEEEDYRLRKQTFTVWFMAHRHPPAQAHPPNGNVGNTA
ncbi:hypothetical protein BDY19DRAFT_906391 [Irpex rosettiformis]|uniref:Uncharacterized protein n=1 Tax=Irpex rosettiformis TaxID=378272 RepID=A0ACB8U3E6_9APHY|nr:hypothetical protein BDY19DRAFT_906391 [Irpex rosettiformis]